MNSSLAQVVVKHPEKRQIPLYLTPREKLKLVGIGIKTSLSSVGGQTLLRPSRFSHFLDFFVAKRYFITEEAGIAHQVGNYMDMVHNGLVRSDMKAKQCLDAQTLEDGTPLSSDQKSFFKSVRIVIEGIRQMAVNLADAAEKKAAEPGITDVRRLMIR